MGIVFLALTLIFLMLSPLVLSARRKALGRLEAKLSHLETSLTAIQDDLRKMELDLAELETSESHPTGEKAANESISQIAKASTMEVGLLENWDQLLTSQSRVQESLATAAQNVSEYANRYENYLRAANWVERVSSLDISALLARQISEMYAQVSPILAEYYIAGKFGTGFVMPDHPPEADVMLDRRAQWYSRDAYEAGVKARSA